MKLLNIDFKNEISTEDLSFFLVQWYSGQCLTTSSLKKKPRFTSFAESYGINFATMAYSKLLRRCH